MDQTRKTAITGSGSGTAKISVSNEEDSADITTSPSPPTNADSLKKIQEFKLNPNASEFVSLKHSSRTVVELPEDPFYSPSDTPSAPPMHDLDVVPGVDEMEMTRAHFDRLNISFGVDRQTPSGYVSSSAFWNPSSDYNARTSQASYFRKSSHSVVLDPADFTSFYENKSSEAEMLKRLESFKKFDVVQDYSDHYFRQDFYKANPAQGWVNKILREWKSLGKNLPGVGCVSFPNHIDAISVRVYHRMDLLRAVIVGTDGTPYHDGLFFFDIRFPPSYPRRPPLVNYHSGGLRINPNLSVTGRVCLSLLDTWDGAEAENWRPNKSTMLQVLVSIQGLVLNAEPFYNEDRAYLFRHGTLVAEMHSKKYSENAFLLSLKTMLYSIRNPPKHFEDFVLGHFYNKAHHILRACRAYLDGAPLGSEVTAPTEGNEKRCCSELFKTYLPVYINTLAKAFSKIGVQDCERYTIPMDQHSVAD